MVTLSGDRLAKQQAHSGKVQNVMLKKMMLLLSTSSKVRIAILSVYQILFSVQEAKYLFTEVYKGTA